MGKYSNEEILIVAGLVVAFAGVIYISVVTNMDLFQLMIGQFEEFFGMVNEDDFLRNAVLLEFAYEILPQTAQVLGLGAITTRLLQTGINPYVLGIITATGRLIGQILLYFAGRFIAKFIFKNRKKEASAMHFMHRFHFIIFLTPAWLGALGDIIMLTAGHQKINLIKIIPILFIGNLLDAYKWIFWGLATIEASDLMQQ